MKCVILHICISESNQSNKSNPYHFTKEKCVKKMVRINQYVDYSKPVSTELTRIFKKYMADLCISPSTVVIYQHIIFHSANNRISIPKVP